MKTFDTNVNRKFKDVWVLKMSWTNPIFNEVIMVIHIKCCVCFKIEKKKVLAAKWDSIEKHTS